MARLGVTLETTFDARRMRGDVADDLEGGLVRLADAIEEDTRRRWSGWEAGTGRSQRAWEAVAVLSPGATRGDVLLANDARDDRGRYYAGFVHRAGSRVREVERVRARLAALAAVQADTIGEELAETLNTPGPSRDRR